MSNSQEAVEPQLLPESSRLELPPRSTPSPDATESESKLSRKREREVSVEPGTPSAHNDTDPALRERKDSSSRTPLKKNRRRLDPTQEEEDGNGSGSRSGSSSPPNMTVESPRQQMKIKVRQISRGVEDITWKSMDSIPAREGDDETVSQKQTDVIIEEVDAQPTPEKTDHIDVDDVDTLPKTPDETPLNRSLQEVRNEDSTMEPATPEVSRLRAGSEATEKGLKRKYLERGTSQGPPEQGDASQHPSEPLKRLRDESDKDANLRETKRPSPPPSPPRASPPSPKVPKMGGFMAYASTSSPFASVKGQSIFGSKVTESNTAISPFSANAAATPSPLAPAAELNSPFGQSSSSSSLPSTSASAPQKLTGFAAFASSSSPFATAARTNIPIIGSTSQLGGAKSSTVWTNSTSTSNSNPFASYVGSSQGFAVPALKRARATSPDSSSRSSVERVSEGVFKDSPNRSESGDDEQESEHASFGARLRAGRDEEEENKSDEENQKVMLTEQDVMTGEEEEETIHQVRGKLFSLDDNTWRERGTGLLKLNVKQDDGTGARLVMRKDAVYTLLLNVTLFPGMRVSLAQDPRYIRFSAIENGVATTYNLKVSNAKIAADLLEEINANIPT